MKVEVKITDDTGNIRQYVVSGNSSSEDKSLNDFILEALSWIKAELEHFQKCKKS